MNDTVLRKCVIVSQYPFPRGMAATNRILAYSRGLVESGVEVEVLVHTPTSRGPVAEFEGDRGLYKGVRYFHTMGQTASRFRLVRGISVISGFRRFWGYLSTARALYVSKTQKAIDCVIISLDDPLSLFVYASLARQLGSRSVFIFDEYPIPIRHKLKSAIPRWKEALYKWCLSRVTGYVAISEELGGYYRRLCDRSTLVLPVIADVSRFEGPPRSGAGRPREGYICYMGNMELAKDNVDNIVKAFGLIASSFPAVSLRLYGSASRATEDFLKALVSELRLSARVEMPGRVGSEEVPAILQGAIMLVSSQPDTVRARGGFPTKLGEYLASGVPAIMTDVGENARYVRNGEHVYLVVPNDPAELARRMKHVLVNYEEAQRVAAAGRQLVFEKYSHHAMGGKLKAFIETL